MIVYAVVRLYAPDGGGAEYALAAILEHAVARGHEVHVRRTVPGVFQPRRGVRIDQPYARHPDVVIGQLDGTAAARVCASDHDVPLVVYAHAPAQAGIPADDVWANAHHTAQPGQLVVRPHVEPAAYRTHLPDPERSRFHSLVNLQEAKGASLVYDVARRLGHEEFLAVCGGWGPQVAPPPLRNVVQRPYSPDPVRDVYRDSRVMLMPSSEESWGRVAVEAACSGIPTVAHPTAGLVEALGDAGVWADRRSVDAYADALACLRDPPRYRCHSTAARDRAEWLAGETRGDLDAAVDRLERLVG